MAHYSRLTFAWWNTGLSPVGKQRYTDNQFTEALGVISILLEGLQVDFLGLGEITSDELVLSAEDAQLIGRQWIKS
jgi:hypothetical protein